MESYTILREFADSWMLLLLFVFFVGMVIWVFRPGSGDSHKNTAEIPFRHEYAPAPDTEKAPAQSKAARS